MNRQEYFRQYHEEHTPDKGYMMEISEIAAALGVSTEAVRQTLRRAERKFRERWVERFGEFELEGLTDMELIHRKGVWDEI